MDQAEPMFPRVASEFATVRKLLKGKSIARFGDGELKILEGKGYSREESNPALTKEMRALVELPHEDCLLAIPTMHQKGPKYVNWLRHEVRFCRYFRRDDSRRYYSAFITRPDSAADTLESQEYVDLVASLWRGRGRVAVVSEPTSKVLTFVRATNEVVHVECPSHRAYSQIDSLEREVCAAEPSIALLSAGPTATCLANRLAARGIQAIDVGSIGGLLTRWMRQEPKNKGSAT